MGEQLTEEEHMHNVRQEWKDLSESTRSALRAVCAVRIGAHRLGTTACDWEYEGDIERDMIAALEQAERSLRHIERMAALRLAELNDD